MDEFKNDSTNLDDKKTIDEREQTQRSELSPIPPKRRNVFWPALFGAMVGGLIVWFLLSNLTNGPKQQIETAKEPTDKGQVSERVSVDINTDITEIVGEVADAVVGVSNIQTVREFWSTSETTAERGTGSGVLYKKDGDKAYLVTNHHVVEDATELEITFDDGSKTSGKMIGSDIWTDLAVIEIDSKNVKTIVEFGDSDSLKRGEPVIAIGNPLGLGFSGSVTVGVVSGKDRSIPIDIDNNGSIDWQADVLQTDAAINPGNSGGALINLAGQLIGINSMKISEATVEGIGLAIPINLAIPVIEQLESTGAVDRPTMGVTLYDLRSVPAQQQREVLKIPVDVTDGVVVTEVLESSPAEQAGVKKYDTIVEMDGEKIEDMVGLRKHLYNEKKVGETMTMKIYREGQLLEIEMILKNGNSF